MTDLARLVGVLAQQGVDFIIVGGFAGTLHGSSVPTQDLDVVYARDPQNLRRVIAALAPFDPYLRGAPSGLPFTWDERTIQAGLNFTLTTSIGVVDLLGEIAGGGSYERLLPHAVSASVFGVDVRFLGLEKLIEVKRAAGRTKDLLAVADLEALLEERDRSD